MNGMTTLAEFAARARAEVAERRRSRPLEDVLRAAPTPIARRSFLSGVSRPERVNVIAEFKRRSPSRGVIRDDLGVGVVARAYQEAGAAALSVLTEGPNFGGSLQDLQAARVVTRLPVLRKDFIVDPYQLGEAWISGADAVLVVVAVLSDAELRALVAGCSDYALDALVEVHDKAELDRALAAGARLVGVNNRDLKTMEVRPQTALDLAPAIPAGVVAVAESGIESGAELRRLGAAGYSAFLVGTSLMSAPDPGVALRRMLEEAA